MVLSLLVTIKTTPLKLRLNVLKDIGGARLRAEERERIRRDRKKIAKFWSDMSKQ